MQLHPNGYDLVLGQYMGGRPAIQVMGRIGEAICNLTVNLVQHQLDEGEFHVRIQTRTNVPEVFDALIKSGAAAPTGKFVSAGFVEKYAEVWALKLGETD